MFLQTAPQRPGAHVQPRGNVFRRRVSTRQPPGDESADARADFESVYQRKTGTSRILWLLRSSEVRAAVRAWQLGAVETAVRRTKRALRGALAPSDR